jgi:APA family basic amino acid/polyamine antiporter
MLTIIAFVPSCECTYLSLLPVQSLEDINRNGKIAAVEAVRVFWGSYGALFISLLICLTTLGCANATVFDELPYLFRHGKRGHVF